MPKNQSNTEDKKVEVTKASNNHLVDDYALQSFKAMGFSELTDNMVTIYREFKLNKDRIHPGKVTPEGLAMIAVMAAIVDETLEPAQSPKK